jgi:LPXTG-motif cell wall-anchored protein
VQSGTEGEKVIAPGTGSTYRFQVKNTGGGTLDYWMTITEKFECGSEQVTLPVRVKLRKLTAGEAENTGKAESTGEAAGAYLLGATDKWAAASELNTIQKAQGRQLAANEYETYELEWQWPFESETEAANETEAVTGLGDENDTNLGNIAALGKSEVFNLETTETAEEDQNTNFNITITIYAEGDASSGGGGGGGGTSTPTEDESQEEGTSKVNSPGGNSETQEPDDTEDLGDLDQSTHHSGNNPKDGGDDGDGGSSTTTEKTGRGGLFALLPKTGDTTSVLLWVMIMLACATGAVALIACSRKQKAANAAETNDNSTVENDDTTG